MDLTYHQMVTFAAQCKFKLQEWCVDELRQGSLPTFFCIFYEARK